MLDFETELERLLARESAPLPHSELAELAAAGQNMLTELHKKNTELSLQVEEIYDLVKEADSGILREALDDEKRRTGRLAAAVVALCDLLEHFCAYTRQSGSEDLELQACLLWKNAAAVLEGCGITRLGEEGQYLDPEIHTVESAVASSLPREYVVRVLQSGYRYLGNVLRRAAVVVSTGAEYPERKENE
ncbi:MAG: nucleotide exchange factor GrpE [Treponema sp.]|jgi:molecular chaperone GrpE (heat shock protein)|nr:nucleotide exchange factor GrpE [Treponema sp.]